MKNSKSKKRRLNALRYFVAVHQDALMEGFARGFIAPRSGRLEAESVVTSAAVECAKRDAEWGDVVLLEVAAPNQEVTSVGVPQPLLLTDVIGCWTRSADIAVEIEARLETFEDTIPGVVKIVADPALFPQEASALQDSLPLQIDAGELYSDVFAEDSNRRNATSLEKIAGGLSMVRSRANTGALGFDSLEDLLAMSLSDGATGECGIAGLASHVYRVLRPEPEVLDDERIFVKAAMGLKDKFPAQGLDPVAFIDLLGEGEDMVTFLETLRKVLDNRIELSSSRLDDTGLVGQRALLLFLLAPRADEMARWLRARPIGPVVGTLASFLSGIYCGLGGISRELKGADPEAMLSVVQAASSVLNGLPLQVRVSRTWDERAVVRERIEIDGRDFFVRTVHPSERVILLLASVRDAGCDVRVDPESGEYRVSADGGGSSVTMEIVVSAFRLPESEVVRLAFWGRTTARGKPSKELLVALLDGSLRPVVGTVDGSGLVRLDVEVDGAEFVAAGMSRLLQAAGSIGLKDNANVVVKKRVKKMNA